MDIETLAIGAVPLIVAIFCTAIGGLLYFLGHHWCVTHTAEFFGATRPNSLGQRMRMLSARRSPLALTTVFVLGAGWLLFVGAAVLALLSAFIFGLSFSV